MIKFNKEEIDTNRETIAKAEAIWNKNFPVEYVEFLLQNNGVEVNPNFPTVSNDKNSELSCIERFCSVNDLILQKKYKMSYTYIDQHYEEDLEEFGIDRKDLLTIAIAERGCYYINLSEEQYGQIYHANYQGGDGIIKLNTNSFKEFLNSFGTLDGEDIDTNFSFSNEYNSAIKAMQDYLFETPDKPELGFQRFKEVFEYYEQTTPQKDGHRGIVYHYVDDRLKLEYLIEKGCETANLLRGAKKADTIDYLVNVLKLDINKMVNGRYPLQNYLVDRPDYYAKQNYELIDELMKRGIQIDWSIETKTHDGNEEPPTIDRLLNLHKKYQQMIVKDDEFKKKYKRPSGLPPFIKSELIEKKLGVSNNNNWIDK